MGKPTTQQDRYYLEVDKKITKQLDEEGVKTNQKAVSIVRGIYFSNGKSLSKTIDRIQLKIDRAETSKKKLWEKCRELVSTIDPKFLPILFKEKVYDPAKARVVKP